MMEPIELDDYRGPFIEYPAVCTTCCHEWIVFQPQGGNTVHLECPNCGHCTGGRVEENEDES